MLTIQTLVLVAHVVISVMIIGLVLLQRGKGAEAGTGFGAGASGTVFGAKGSANFLSRSTAAMATLFFLTSLGLAYIGSQRPESRSLLDEQPPAMEQPELLPTQPADESAVPDLPALPETEPLAEEPVAPE